MNKGSSVGRTILAVIEQITHESLIAGHWDWFWFVTFVHISTLFILVMTRGATRRRASENCSCCIRRRLLDFVDRCSTVYYCRPDWWTWCTMSDSVQFPSIYMAIDYDTQSQPIEPCSIKIQRTISGLPDREEKSRRYENSELVSYSSGRSPSQSRVADWSDVSLLGGQRVTNVLWRKGW